MVPNNAQFDDRIRNLLALAEDNSTESRTLLFSHICDLFLQERPMESDNQQRMLIEIINELISDVDVSIRIELRHILLNMDHPPSELTKLISEDDIEVSGKLLEDALIDEEQLLYLIKYASDEHRDHIGRRFGLSPLLRRELDRVRKETEANAKIALLALQAENKKISLQELEEAEQNSTELNEDTTASILETLRAKKHQAKLDLSVVPAPEKVDANDSLSPPETISLTAKIGLSDHIIDETHKVEEKEPTNSPIEEDSFEYVKEAVSQLIEHEVDIEEKQEEPVEPVTQPSVTSITDEIFWEIDRYGNISYLSDNSEALFLLPAERMMNEDFLCLWHREHEGEKNDNEFIALFEKRLPFRDQPFSIDVSPNVIHQYLLSAIATFDILNGRFTGFRGSAHIDNNQFNDEELTVEINNPTSSTLKSEVAKPTFNKSGNVLDIKGEHSNENNDEVLTENDPSDEVAAELLHNLSHEFRTPLNAIIGFSQMIDSEMWGPVSDQYKNNTKNIIYAANHLKDAVNNILDSAKVEAGLILPTPESFS
ncbi:MAG: histidine kinase dimerization/phospho-acceptor domain-containing protein, partial [Emcibacteraceae bacterium]|nr:histidine kinase dimerization/phospho-acceptor domain-containing protein [Emcibacteraceae bacterium]